MPQASQIWSSKPGVLLVYLNILASTRQDPIATTGLKRKIAKQKIRDGRPLSIPSFPHSYYNECKKITQLHSYPQSTQLERLPRLDHPSIITLIDTRYKNIHKTMTFVIHATLPNYHDSVNVTFIPNEQPHNRSVKAPV
ncbi:hypothetical protein EYC84_006608 [Monilinia fructicola]|uniref:Uncharacterized protein n=1 Tax=Monilinia fructicola TaxID=38448 RepID=A0A5M9K6M3_MONFR|nr:hypothetical protein EYC84_006608 [Monilinia fructicola]